MQLNLWAAACVQPHALTQIAQMIMSFNILNKNNPYFMHARPMVLIGFCCYDTKCVLLFYFVHFFNSFIRLVSCVVVRCCQCVTYTITNKYTINVFGVDCVTHMDSVCMQKGQCMCVENADTNLLLSSDPITQLSIGFVCHCRTKFDFEQIRTNQNQIPNIHCTAI